MSSYTSIFKNNRYILFGVPNSQNIGDDFFRLNLILAPKLFIYNSKLNSSHPSIQVSFLKVLYQVEKKP